MQSLKIVYIAPGSDAQARIYIADADVVPRSVREHYLNFPQAWSEIGLIDHKGSIRCLKTDPLIQQDLIDQMPLMAGTSFTYYEDGHVVL